MLLLSLSRLDLNADAVETYFRWNAEKKGKNEMKTAGALERVLLFFSYETTRKINRKLYIARGKNFTSLRKLKGIFLISIFFFLFHSDEN